MFSPGGRVPLLLVLGHRVISRRREGGGCYLGDKTPDVVCLSPTCPERMPPPLDACPRPGTGVGCVYILLSESAEQSVFDFYFSLPL